MVNFHFLSIFDFFKLGLFILTHYNVNLLKKNSNATLVFKNKEMQTQGY